MIVLAVFSTLYMKASEVPQDYKPITLTVERKAEVRKAMETKLSDFIRQAGEIHKSALAAASGAGGGAGGAADATATDQAAGPIVLPNREFKMEIGQDEINEWTAAATEKLENSLQQFGMSQPAIAFGDNRLTFYSNWDKYGKVVGLDMSLDFDAESAMTIKISSARMGSLPVPEAALKKHKKEIVKKLQNHVKNVGSGGSGPLGLFNEAADKVATALDGKPVKLDIRRGFGNVRIRGIKMEEGKMTLDVAPLPAEGAEGPLPMDAEKANAAAAAQGQTAEGFPGGLPQSAQR